MQYFSIAFIALLTRCRHAKKKKKKEQASVDARTAYNPAGIACSYTQPTPGTATGTTFH